MTIKGIAGFKAQENESLRTLRLVQHAGHDYQVLEGHWAYASVDETKILGILHGAVKGGAPVDLAIQGSVSKVIAEEDIPAGRPVGLASNGGVRQHRSGELCLGISLQEALSSGQIINILVYSPHKID